MSTDFHIAAVAVPKPGEDPGAIRTAVAAVCDIESRHARHILGHDDFASETDEALHFYPEQTDRRKLFLRAVSGRGRGHAGADGFPVIEASSDLDPDEVLGGAGVFSSRTGNAHAADTEVMVREDVRRRGIGTALARAAEQVAAGWGCSRLAGWSWHRVAEPGQATTAVHGSEVDLPLDEVTAFALSTGQELAQVERQSTMPVPERPFPVPPIASGYTLVQWTGVVPEEHAADIAGLMAAMWTDTPLGGFDVKPEPIDAERVLRQSRVADVKYRDVLTAVRHEASGQLVGFTDIAVRRTNPSGGLQGDTLVRKDHRGHGLGLEMKSANVAHLQVTSPPTRRVHTWNAGENRYMWPINERLGYRTASVGGGWEKSL